MRLSYTWGPDYSPCHIILENSAFTVTSNFYSALRYLRLEDTDRTVWIDALCIDQTNNSERGEQVSKMREIYSHAAETFIWLGDGTRNNELAMQHLSLASTSEQPELWFASRLQTSFEKEKVEWTAVMEQFKIGYWSRVWIIQESAVSSDLIVCCGQFSIAWEVAVAAQKAWTSFRATADSKHIQLAIELVEDVTSADGSIVEPVLTPRYNGPMPLSSNRDKIANTESSYLLGLLRDNWSALATDPRDKIYALQGLATDCHNPPLEVNYSSSHFDTYLATMNYFLCNHGNLDMITYSGNHILLIPSSFYRVSPWVPTFYWAWEAPTTSVSSQYIYKSVAIPIAASGIRKSKASFGPTFRRFDCLLGIHRVTLRAQAYRIDRISKNIFHPGSIGFGQALGPELSRLRKKLNIATDWLPAAFFAGLAHNGVDRGLVDQVRTIYYHFVHDEKRNLGPESIVEAGNCKKNRHVMAHTCLQSHSRR
jgi:hypothetical protein